MDDKNNTKSKATGTSPRRKLQKPQETPQLSCAYCRDHKSKCDKMAPCSKCNSLGIVCCPIYRLRRPRGRHVNRERPLSLHSHSETAHRGNEVNQSLNDRIRELESVVNNLRPLVERSGSMTPASADHLEAASLSTIPTYYDSNMI
ncbi:hypothetical protein F5Y15DRAFT_115038 [Xylariaceae sp. FL0016]|nr:hypothetical protein F5Y15DRAFT_115038 [Xylariaceae sp. FL0016]